MKKTLTFERLINPKDNSKTYYHTNHPLRNFPNKTFNLEEELNHLITKVKFVKDKKKYKKEVQEIVEKGYINCVAISDAHTHKERLVFPAIKMSDGYLSIISFLQIDGEYTMMISGGNSDYMYEHEYYLERIAKCNGFDTIEIIDNTKSTSSGN